MNSRKLSYDEIKRIAEVEIGKAEMVGNVHAAAAWIAESVAALAASGKDETCVACPTCKLAVPVKDATWLAASGTCEVVEKIVGWNGPDKSERCGRPMPCRIHNTPSGTEPPCEPDGEYCHTHKRPIVDCRYPKRTEPTCKHGSKALDLADELEALAAKIIDGGWMQERGGAETMRAAAAALRTKYRTEPTREQIAEVLEKRRTTPMPFGFGPASWLDYADVVLALFRAEAKCAHGMRVAHWQQMPEGSPRWWCPGPVDKSQEHIARI